MSFWKHEPPNPTDAFRNLEPMRSSNLSAFETYGTLRGQQHVGDGMRSFICNKFFFFLFLSFFLLLFSFYTKIAIKHII